MANQLSPEQQLWSLLTQDQNSNHQLLTYYLKLILSGRPLDLKLVDDTIHRFSPEQTWQEIIAWATKNEVSLPMGDGGSRKIRASRLLNYLELNVQGKTREAAANFQAIRESSKTNAFQSISSITPKENNYLKALEIRRLQLNLINDKILGKLSTDIQQTRYLQKFKGDPNTYSMLSGLLAADAINLRSIPKDEPNRIADEITQLVQLKYGYRSINNAAHLAYADSAEQDLPELLDVINFRIKAEYGDQENEFQQDMSRYAALSGLTTISDIPTLVNLVAHQGSDNQRFATILQQTILASSTSGYVSGEAIIKAAIASAGLPDPDNVYTQLSKLAPLIEEVHHNEAKNILGGNIFENDPRLLHTLNLSRDIAVSPKTPWITSKDLQAQEKALHQKYGSGDLQQILEAELSLETTADYRKIVDINDYFKSFSDHRRYQQSLANNTLYSLRDNIGKARGNFTAVKSPIDRFTQKIGKTYWKVDDFVHAPFNYLVDKWVSIQERFPILNPGKLIYTKISDAQRWVALKIYKWSTKIAKSNRWYAGAFRQISEFSKIFFKENADWHLASYTFIQKKWGNLLEWGAKKAGRKSLQAIKAEIGTKLWDGFSKLAPGIAKKMSAGALGELIASFTAGTLSGGTTILIQIGLALVWEGLKGIWKFIKNTDNFRDKLISKIPAILGVLSIGLAALPGAIAAGLIAGGSALIATIGSLITSLLSTIFLPAVLAVGAMIIIFFLLFQTFSTSTHLDSEIVQQIVSNILCNDSSEPSTEPVNKVASCASCLVKYLTECYGESINATTLSKGVGCLIAKSVAPDVASIIEGSTTKFTNLQCVGFVQAAIACGGGSLAGNNACGYVAGAPGYKFTPGLAGASPGDPVVFKSSGTCGEGAPGHIGILKEDAGALVCLIDANQVCDGCPSDNNCLPKTNLAGYLKKI